MAMDWNKSPRRFTIDVPEPFVPLIEQRRREMLYPSVSKYAWWTIFYDIFLRKPHRFTSWLLRQSGEKQQQVLEAVIENFDSPNKPGSWYEAHARERAVELIESGELDGAVKARAAKLGMVP